jgi:alpha-N-acetylglucosamine transferase
VRRAARQAWNLTELSKVIFLDADPRPLQPIDSLAEHPSAFAAAPDTFPADQFNSGVMVLRPNPNPEPSS